uniref:SAP domain-containing protein n=1 Tax=Fundulus heteroclitus TaxID=8078 RepID=A0A3Q2QY51_FUNHE
KACATGKFTQSAGGSKMADEDITLDGKPLQSLRVADLKAALEQRNLPKSGQKNTLLKRLKGVSFRPGFWCLCRVRLSSVRRRATASGEGGWMEGGRGDQRWRP